MISELKEELNRIQESLTHKNNQFTLRYFSIVPKHREDFSRWVNEDVFPKIELKIDPAYYGLRGLFEKAYGAMAHSNESKRMKMVEGVLVSKGLFERPKHSQISELLGHSKNETKITDTSPFEKRRLNSPGLADRRSTFHKPPSSSHQPLPNKLDENKFLPAAFLKTETDLKHSNQSNQGVNTFSPKFSIDPNVNTATPDIKGKAPRLPSPALARFRRENTGKESNEEGGNDKFSELFDGKRPTAKNSRSPTNAGRHFGESEARIDKVESPNRIRDARFKEEVKKERFSPSVRENSKREGLLKASKSLGPEDMKQRVKLANDSPNIVDQKEKARSPGINNSVLSTRLEGSKSQGKYITGIPNKEIEKKLETPGSKINKLNEHMDRKVKNQTGYIPLF